MSDERLLAARWIIPVEPEGLVLEEHALAIRDTQIRDILPLAEALRRYPHAPVERFDRHVLIPGLVNTHTHAAMTLLRGVADDLPLMDWLSTRIWPLEQALADAGFVRDGSLLAAAEMIRGGVTCCNDMYFFPEAAAEAFHEAGMRAMLGMIVIDFPSRWADDAEGYLARGLELHQSLSGDPLLGAMLAPHAPYTVSDAPLRRIAELSERLDLRVHIHVHETQGEVETAQAETGRRPIARLHDLGLVSPRLLAVHMTQLTDGEIGLWAQAGAQVLHCPESNLKLASGFCPVLPLLEAGVNVALGTDGAASNNDLDLLGEARTAALLAKGLSADASALPAARALHMATLGGARALGLDDRIGSLRPGKQADLVALRLDSLETQPLYDPVSQLIYATGRQAVSEVWVAGRRLLRERSLCTLDEERLLTLAHDWHDRIVATLS